MRPLLAEESSGGEDEAYLPDDAVALAHKVADEVGPQLQAAAASMVIEAAKPWCVERHALWPAATHEYVWFLLLVGNRLQMPAEVWVANVLPHVAVRRCGPVPRWELEDVATCGGISQWRPPLSLPSGFTM